MKKIFTFLRNFFVFIGWSFVFVSVSNALLRLIWNFDFLSSRSWNVLNTFWNSGGVIKTPSDVLLFAALFLLPFLWLIGFGCVKKLDFLKIFLFPITLVLNIFDSADSKETKRIVLKNLKSSQQTAEDYKIELETAEKPKKSQEAQNIRAEISQKRYENEIENNKK